MPGALIDRPKMTKTMYQALKRHIMKERERKKQAQEQDAIMMERLKKEEEMRKKKEQEDSLTLEQTKEQIAQLDKKMEELKTEKHELFSQLKKVLHQEDESRKKAQLKEQSELQIMQHSTVLGLPHAMSGRPMLYRPPQPTSMVQPVSMKRGRSPSPPPSQSYQYSNKMMAVEKPHPYPHSTQPDYKQPSNFPQTQAGPVYPSQSASSHAYQQAGYVPSKSPVKYNPGGQSAFSSYSNPYAHQQSKQLQESGYPGYRMQQPGYIATQHGSNIPLQKQLEHANQQSGFNEEKYKLQQQGSAIRGVAPMAGQQPIMHQSLQMQQQQQQSKGSIVTGYAARGQTPNSTTQYQPPNINQPNYTNQSRPQHHMSGQHPGRYF